MCSDQYQFVSLLTLLSLFYFLFFGLTTFFNSVNAIAMKAGYMLAVLANSKFSNIWLVERLHIISNYYRHCTYVYAYLALPPNMSFKLLFTMTIHFWNNFPYSNCALIKKKLIFTLDRVGKSISFKNTHSWYMSRDRNLKLLEETIQNYEQTMVWLTIKVYQWK